MACLWRGWQDLCYRIHRVPEKDHEQLTRLAHTPPEFWRFRDWMDSRRLRSRRQIALRKAEKQGLSPRKLTRIVEKFPEGEFWPRTPRYNRDWRDMAMDSRLVEGVRDALGPGVQLLFDDVDGEVLVVDPFTGNVVPAHWYVV